MPSPLQVRPSPPSLRSLALCAALCCLPLMGQQSCEAQCPDAPDPSLTLGGGLVAVPSAGFQLAQTGASAGYVAAIEGLAQVLPAAPPEVIAGDLNRVATRVDASALPEIDDFHIGFAWNSGDEDVSYWVPQGITGTGDAYDEATFAGRKFVLVSWHYDTEAGGTDYDKGVRISFADVTDMNAVRYRHVLLVEPILTAGQPDFKAVPIHAGGIAWYGDLLYVADTQNGLRVFDVGAMLQVPTSDSDHIGYAGGAYAAYGYKYVLPQVAAWVRTDGSCQSVFSFVSLDRSTSPHALLTGEYSADTFDGLLLRWPLDEAAHTPLAPLGTATASAAYQVGQTKVQGALAQGGQVWLSSSSQSGKYGALYRTAPGVPSVSCPWADGPEDLTYAPASDNLWMATEDAGHRYVFAVKLADLGG